MKKVIAGILTCVVTVALCIFMAACTQKYTVGDTWSNDNVKIKLDSSEYSVYGSTVWLNLTLTINTTSEFRMNVEDLYVCTSLDKKNFIDAELNAKAEGSYNLGEPIIGEKHYTFSFVLPAYNFIDENNEIIKGKWEIRCFIGPATFSVTVKI